MLYLHTVVVVRILSTKTGKPVYYPNWKVKFEKTVKVCNDEVWYARIRHVKSCNKTICVDLIYKENRIIFPKTIVAELPQISNFVVIKLNPSWMETRISLKNFWREGRHIYTRILARDTQLEVADFQKPEKGDVWKIRYKQKENMYMGEFLELLYRTTCL